LVIGLVLKSLCPLLKVFLNILFLFCDLCLGRELFTLPHNRGVHVSDLLSGTRSRTSIYKLSEYLVLMLDGVTASLLHLIIQI
jgi:hypothetical protein